MRQVDLDYNLHIYYEQDFTKSVIVITIPKLIKSHVNFAKEEELGNLFVRRKGKGCEHFSWLYRYYLIPQWSSCIMKS